MCAEATRTGHPDDVQSGWLQAGACESPAMLAPPPPDSEALLLHICGPHTVGVAGLQL